jgi:hypothetical protein
MIQVTRCGTEISSSTEVLEDLRSQFEQRHWFLLPRLIEPELLDLIQQEIDRGEFRERIHDGINSNKELCLTASAALAGLIFLINDEKLFRLIQEITHCDPINSFDGRVYRIVPEQGHHDSWHNDIGEERLVAMSINLSREVFEGGVLQIRQRDSEKILSESANTGSGDAVIFRLGTAFEHRISNVQGDASKTAFAGWFKAKPNTVSSDNNLEERTSGLPFAFRLRSRDPRAADHIY